MWFEIICFILYHEVVEINMFVKFGVGVTCGLTQHFDDYSKE